MASEKSPWANLFCSCLPSTRPRTVSNPSLLPSPVHASTPPGQALHSPASPNSITPLMSVVAKAPRAGASPAIGALKVVLGGLQSSLKELPPLQLAIGGFLECIVHLEVAEQNRQAYEELILDLTNLTTILQKHVVESRPHGGPYSIENVARAIGEETESIKVQLTRSQLGQLATAKGSEEAVLKCYRRIGALFQQLQVDISLSIWDAMEEERMNAILERLLPAYDAYHNAALPTSATKRAGCTEGTRVDVLDATQSWSRQEDGPKIYWLNGMAGTGKTTIAYTLCELLEAYKQLGATFFCSRNSPDCRNINKIIPTIAYQLGRYSNPFRRALCGALKTDPDAAKRKIGKQFETLISKPLAEMGKAMPTDVIVVIDALDECEDVDGTRQVLNTLFRHAGGLPIKFFVSSRPEPVISTGMTTSEDVTPSILRLHDISQSLVQADIRLYLAQALSSVHITPSELDELAARSGSLFIFAATSVRYIIPTTGPVDHRRRLEAVLKLDPSQGHKSYKDVDRLYVTILSSAFDAEVFEREELSLRQRVLWTVICAREPLTIPALAEVLHTANDEAVLLAIQPLQSVLYIPEGTNLVSTLHASFPDFLLSKERAGQLRCDKGPHEWHLTQCCFKLMDRSLRFNICGLKSSFELDRDIPDLQYRVDQNISTGLFYVCRYWSDHLTSNPSTSLSIPYVESFLEGYLLFWMEVLSLKGTIGHGEAVLRCILAWLPDESTRVRDFTYDAHNFLTSFAGNPTSLSTPHIYVSVLPFTSEQSLVRVAYMPRTRGLIRVEGAAIDTGRRAALATWAAGASVRSLALSKDGKRLASGSDDCEVSIWDVSSGTRILGPLEGHDRKGEVWSVAYSPNTTHIASGSSDNTIRIWDSRKGGSTASPLYGHTDTVLSVAFSPDGTHLASGSADRAIRIWDTHSGTQVGEPLEAHQGAVQSIAFSPNGEHLASGSADCTIQVWDWKQSMIAQGKFEGHTGAVYSIAYSNDGRRLVSGSADRSVRVWDTLNGALLAGPFQGHARSVSCASFSPNGTRIVSGSYDSTVRVWDTVSGVLVAGPFEGHADWINSVLFTADGTRVVSGSRDGTIRVWDARPERTGAPGPSGHTRGVWSVGLSPDGTQTASGSKDHTICVWDTHNGALVAGPFRGHTDWVNAVAFSPDGTRIVSGSADHTLRTWDASTGALLVGPIEGHTEWVWSVAFSPDGNLIASGSGDYTVRLWDSHTGAAVTEFKGHTAVVTSAAFSPSGARIASGSWDKTVRMWDVNGGSLLWTSQVHTSVVHCVAFPPDGTRVVSGSWDHTILVLDARDGAVLRGPFRGHTHWIYSFALSPTGTRVASGSEDKTVRIWDIENGTTVTGPLKPHTGGVKSLAFSPDGARIISADGTLRIWDIAAAEAGISDDWSIDDNGWLINSESRRLFWVPSDLSDRFGFLTSSTPIVINASCTTRIDASTLLGDRWSDCWSV